MELFIDGKKVRYNPYDMKKDICLEVEVYKIGAKVVKFFQQNPSKKVYISKKSIEKMKNIKTNRILLPTAALLDKKRKIRGYQMDYIKNLGEDSYFYLDKDKLREENKLLKADIEILSDNNVLIDDLNPLNTIYHNGLYLIDPGSYQYDPSIDKNQAYEINIERINGYLIFDIIRNYHLKKYSILDNYASFAFSKKINNEYINSNQNDAIDFLSNIEEDNLGDFVKQRVYKR